MITKGPIDTRNCTEDILYFSSARLAFKYLLCQLNFGKDEKILLPAYIGITDREGSGVMDPVWECGLNYEFFTLDGALNANLASIEEQVSGGGVKALFLIHYFGFPQKDLLNIRAICDACQICLIEDCAHSLDSSEGEIPLGSVGDFSIFSIHKSIPTQSGGFLRSNRKDLELSRHVSLEDRITLDDLETFSVMNRSAIAEKRIENYEYLANLLKDCPELTPMFPQLNQGVVPLNLPVLVSEGNREPLYFYLMEKGFPTIALYYRLIDDLKTGRFETSQEISGQILNLPVHQDITASDLCLLCTTIKRFYLGVP